MTEESKKTIRELSSWAIQSLPGYTLTEHDALLAELDKPDEVEARMNKKIIRDVLEEECKYNEGHTGSKDTCRLCKLHTAIAELNKPDETEAEIIERMRPYSHETMMAVTKERLELKARAEKDEAEIIEYQRAIAAIKSDMGKLTDMQEAERKRAEKAEAELDHNQLWTLDGITCREWKSRAAALEVALERIGKLSGQPDRHIDDYGEIARAALEARP